MCTVTYLPTSNKGYLLTHNRDEHITRGTASIPKLHALHQQEIIYPTDPDAFGTWISLSKRYTCCLLNGGFERHVRKPPYRYSRGLIILDLYAFSTVDQFLSKYLFNNLEPFTLIVMEHNERLLHEIVWHDNEVYHDVKGNSEPHIWSSTTLYDSETRKRRWDAFQLFIQNNSYTQKNALEFHTDGFSNKEQEGFLINREKLSTVSITSIVYEQQPSMTYFDVLQQKNSQIEL